MQVSGYVLGVAGGIGVTAFIYLHSLFKSAGNSPAAPPEVAKESSEYTPGQEPMPPGLELKEQKITYAELSELWRDGETKKVRFGDLAKLWRPESQQEEEKERKVEFTRPDITAFYLDRIRGRPYFKGDVHEAILDLLELLDAEGHCGSVVRQNEKEPEKIYDVDTYNTLAKVPLYRHSINVAIAAMEKVTNPPIVPKAVIAALAHDLGKLPNYYGRFYKSIAHPMVGLAVIEALPNVKGLKWWDEIAAAVKNHHSQSADYLDALIREADQAARLKEMSNAIQQAEQDLQPEAAAVGVAVPAPAPKPAPAPQTPPEVPASAVPNAAAVEAPSAPEPLQQVDAPEAKDEAPDDQPAAGQRRAPLPIIPAATVEPERQERKRVPRQAKDISAWFEPERFMKEMAKIINTTQTGDKFWSALALGSYVYVKPIGLYGLVVRHSKHAPEVVAAGASEQDRDDYLYSVVMELKKLKDCVATEFLGGDRFGAVFVHNPGADGTGTKQFLIPFRSDFFGEDIARAESRRNTLMKKTVALVPAFNKGGN